MTGRFLSLAGKGGLLKSRKTSRFTGALNSRVTKMMDPILAALYSEILGHCFGYFEGPGVLECSSKNCPSIQQASQASFTLYISFPSIA